GDVLVFHAAFAREFDRLVKVVVVGVEGQRHALRQIYRRAVVARGDQVGSVVAQVEFFRETTVGFEFDVFFERFAAYFQHTVGRITDFSRKHDGLRRTGKDGERHQKQQIQYFFHGEVD